MLHLCLDENGLLNMSKVCEPMNELKDNDSCNYIIIHIILITDRILVNKN